MLWGAYGSGRSFWVRIDGYAVNAYNHYGTSSTVTDLSTTLSAGTTYKLEAVFISATEVEFFIDDVSKGTSTTNLPSGTANAEVISIVDHRHTAGASKTSQMIFSEAKFWQAF